MSRRQQEPLPDNYCKHLLNIIISPPAVGKCRNYSYTKVNVCIYTQFPDSRTFIAIKQINSLVSPEMRNTLATPGINNFGAEKYIIKQWKFKGSQEISFYLKLVLVCGYCHCLPLSVWVPVSPSVHQSFHLFIHHEVSVRDNSWPVQARINKFRPQVQKKQVKIPVVFEGGRPWPSRSNLTSKSDAHICIPRPLHSHDCFTVSNLCTYTDLGSQGYFGV